MAYQIVIGGTDWHEFSTTKGLGDFIRWVDSLNVSDYPNLVHLSEYGWTNDLENLEHEINSAIELHPPVPPVYKTVMGLLTNLSQRENSETITISNGLVS